MFSNLSQLSSSADPVYMWVGFCLHYKDPYIRAESGLKHVVLRSFNAVFRQLKIKKMFVKGSNDKEG